VVRSPDELERYTLVSPVEADPRHGRISIRSPVGEALLGRRAGEAIEVATPGGPRRIEIEAIE
jgi:transcription elongation factor GreA